MSVDNNADTGLRLPEDRKSEEQRKAIHLLAARQAVEYAAAQGRLSDIVQGLRQNADTGDLQQFQPHLGLTTPGAPLEANPVDIMTGYMGQLIAAGKVTKAVALINELDPINVRVTWIGRGGENLSQRDLVNAGLPKEVRGSTNLPSDGSLVIGFFGEVSGPLMQQIKDLNNPDNYVYKTPAGEVSRDQMRAIVNGTPRGDGSVLPFRPMYKYDGKVMLFLRSKESGGINALDVPPGEFLNIRARELDKSN